MTDKPKKPFTIVEFPPNLGSFAVEDAVKDFKSRFLAQHPDHEFVLCMKNETQLTRAALTYIREVIRAAKGRGTGVVIVDTVDPVYNALLFARIDQEAAIHRDMIEYDDDPGLAPLDELEFDDDDEQKPAPVVSNVLFIHPAFDRREELSRILRKMNFIKVTAAKDCPEAAMRLRKDPDSKVTLVLVDIDSTALAGVSFIASLKNTAVTVGATVLVMTSGNENAELVKNAKAAGAVGVLTGRVSENDLVKCLGTMQAVETRAVHVN